MNIKTESNFLQEVGEMSCLIVLCYIHLKSQDKQHICEILYYNSPVCVSRSVGTIPWRRAWQPTPVFLPGESPWTEEPGGLQSMGSQRVGHDWEIKHKTICSSILGLHIHIHCSDFLLYSLTNNKMFFVCETSSDTLDILQSDSTHRFGQNKR